MSNVKNIKFKVNTTYADNEDIYVKRASYKNTLYIYIYEKHMLHDKLLVALKVMVYE
jgi:hypothetical protein